MVINSPKKLADTYQARIVDVADPLRLGRVRVHVYGMTDGVQTEELPWAQVQHPLGSGINRGTLPVLKVDDEVMVVFRDGDSRYPVLVASAHNAPNGELHLPAIGVDGPRSSAGVRTTPDELPTSQTINVPYLQDEVSLQHDILIQRRANRSYRILNLAQGSQFEMTKTGAITLHAPHSLWLSTPADLEMRFHTMHLKGKGIVCEIEGEQALAGNTVSLNATSNADLTAGGLLTVSGMQMSTTALDGITTMAGGAISQTSTLSTTVLCGTSYSLTTTTGSIALKTVVGSIELEASPAAGYLNLSVLDGAGMGTPLGGVYVNMLGNVRLQGPVASLEMDATGTVDLKNAMSELSFALSGATTLKNQMAQVELTAQGTVQIKNQAETLGGIMRDLLMEIQNIDVQTAAGRSGKPNNITQLQMISRRLAMLLGNQ